MENIYHLYRKWEIYTTCIKHTKINGKNLPLHSNSYHILTTFQQSLQSHQMDDEICPETPPPDVDKAIQYAQKVNATVESNSESTFVVSVVPKASAAPLEYAVSVTGSTFDCSCGYGDDMLAPCMYMWFDRTQQAHVRTGVNAVVDFFHVFLCV